MKSNIKLLSALVAGCFLSFSVAATSDLPGIAQDTTHQNHSKVRTKANSAGHAVGKGAKKVGHGAKKAGKKVGSATKNTAQKIDRKIDKDQSVD